MNDEFVKIPSINDEPLTDLQTIDIRIDILTKQLKELRKQRREIIKTYK